MTHDATPHDGANDGDVDALEEALTDRREPYARVTIVRREPPVSANVGDRGVVTADGELHGWVGGAACAQSVLTRQGLDAIETGEPRLVGIAPDPETVARPGLEAFPMTCHSEGVLEAFVEPVRPTTELVVVGDSPVARSLVRLADELAVDVTLVVDDADADRDTPAGTTVSSGVDHEAIAEAVGPEPLVIVASMGQYDARGLAAGVAADAPYVGLVASDSRADEEVARAAALLDVDPATVRERVTNPAGVDIAAYTPAELAASLLAEVVDVRSRAAPRNAASSTADTDAGDGPGHGDEDAGDDHAGDGSDDHTGDGSDDTAAVDPVCGMTVDPSSAAASVTHDGTTYHFCCHGCADSFEAEPGSYLDAVEGET